MKPLTIFLFALLVIAIKTQTCAHGQFFNGQRCAPCKANCQCSSEDTCDTCLDGYAFDATFQNCLQCPTAVDSTNVGCAKCCFQIK